MIRPCRLTSSMSPFSRSCCAFGGSLPIKRSRKRATFLVDGDDRLDRAQIAQVVDQLPQLSRAFDVSPEDNEPTRLHPSKKRRRPGIEFSSGHAGKDQLTR